MLSHTRSAKLEVVQVHAAVLIDASLGFYLCRCMPKLLPELPILHVE